jgi:hypothetical protein
VSFEPKEVANIGKLTAFYNVFVDSVVHTQRQVCKESTCVPEYTWGVLISSRASIDGAQIIEVMFEGERGEGGEGRRTGAEMTG